MAEISIAHISDLHRDPSHPLTNAALLDSLVRDRDRYTREDPSVRAPDLIIVSGDLVAGVKPTGPDAAAELARQYAEAGDFLSGLAEAFLHGDRGRIVVVPGNHDMSYPHVQASLKAVNLPQVGQPTENLAAQYVGQLYSPGSTLRWSWKSFRFYEITDQDQYRRRLEPFSRFYSTFYGGARQYSLQPEAQFDVFDYPALGLTIAALNSCNNNDPMNPVASIHPDCIASASRSLRDEQYRRRLRLAVWHHSTNGPPAQLDYLGSDPLQVLIDCGFNLGFHGHQHKVEFIDEKFLFGEDRKITVISAGTLCGGRDALPTGRPRSYNMIQIDTESLQGMLHLRQMHNENLGSPIWGPGAFPSSRKTYIKFTIQPSPDFRKDQTVFILADAERCLTGGRPEEAIELLRPLAQTNDLARRLLIEALVAIEDTKGIIQIFYPPSAPAEIVYVADALWKERKLDRLRELLRSPTVHDSSDPAIAEVRRKYTQRLK